MEENKYKITNNYKINIINIKHLYKSLICIGNLCAQTKIIMRTKRTYPLPLPQVYDFEIFRLSVCFYWCFGKN